MEDFPDTWLDFVTEARKAHSECKRDLQISIRSEVVLRERLSYLESVVVWIKQEEIRLKNDNDTAKD